MVVGSSGEPAVVEHEPLDADLSRCIGEPREGLLVLLEVDRLPGVQDDGSSTALQVRERTHVTVQARAQPVEPRVRPAAQHPRCGEGLARTQHHLAGTEQLPTAEDAMPLGQPLGEAHVVAAPRHVQPPDLTGAEREPRRTDDHEQGGIMAGPAVPSCATPRPLLPWHPLGGPLAAPPSGEIEQLAGPRGYRQRRQQVGYHVAAVARVGERVVEGDHPCLDQGDATPHLQAGLRVVADELDASCVRRGGPVPERRRHGRAAVGPVARDCGRARVPRRQVGQQWKHPGPVDAAVGDGPRQDGRESGGVVGAQVAEVGTPVVYHRDAVLEHDEEAAAVVAQVEPFRARHARGSGLSPCLLRP